MLNLIILIIIIKIFPEPLGIGNVIKNVSIGKKQNKNIFSSPDPNTFASIKPTKIDKPSNNTSFIP